MLESFQRLFICSLFAYTTVCLLGQCSYLGFAFCVLGGFGTMVRVSGLLFDRYAALAKRIILPIAGYTSSIRTVGYVYKAIQ